MIGMFDSGSGGLTVLSAVRECLPRADITYFGDITNAPYGTRSREEITTLTTDAIKLLLDEGATDIVSACNSVSASLAISVFDIFGIAPTQVIEMVGPSVHGFRGTHARILVCATPATIDSGVYQNAFRMVGQEIGTCALPQLAGLVEFGAPDRDIQKEIERGLREVSFDDYDAVLLACTHYPLVRSVFKRVLEGKPVVLFDPAREVANRVKAQCVAEYTGTATLRFLISAESELFRSRVASLFHDESYTIEVVETAT